MPWLASFEVAVIGQEFECACDCRVQSVEGLELTMHSHPVHRVVGIASVLLVATACLGSADAQGRGPKGRGFVKRGPDDAPKVGAVAPTFKLKTLDGKGEVDLSTFRGKRPVVLIFGSYT